MTPCPAWSEALLEAPRHVLKGEGPAPLAEHLRTCPSCARAAAYLLKTEAALDDLLTPGGAPGEAWVEAVLAEAAPWEADGPGEPAQPRRTPAREARWRVTRWLPVAAAAALALLLVASPDRPPGPAAPGAPTASPPLVEAGPHETVAVLQTADPDITVVWFF